MPSKRETVDIETAGATVVLQNPNHHYKNVRIRGDAAASYEIQVSDRDGDYMTHSELTGESDYDEIGDQLTERFVRVEVTSGSGGVDDEADILISSPGP